MSLTAAPGPRMPLWKVDAAAAAIGAAAAAAVWFGGVEPTLRAAAAQEAKRQSLGPQVQRSAVLSDLSNQLTAQLDAARAELAASPLRLEPASKINQRLLSLAELASRIGLDVDQVVPGDVTTGADTVTVAIRLTGRGTFPACKAFLGGLASGFADIAVTGFQLAGNHADGGGRAVFVFDLAWYAAPEGGAPEQSASVPLQ
jgi:hypothetical protein